MYTVANARHSGAKAPQNCDPSRRHVWRVGDWPAHYNYITGLVLEKIRRLWIDGENSSCRYSQQRSTYAEVPGLHTR